MEHLLPGSDDAEGRLYDAMRYASLNGGNAFASFLQMQSAKLFNVDQVRAKRVAGRLEFIHRYSLFMMIYPPWTNADTRRGKPSTHRAMTRRRQYYRPDAWVVCRALSLNFIR